MINSTVSTVQHAAVNPVAEAVRGLAKDRSVWVKRLVELNPQWVGFSNFAGEVNREINAIDMRIDELLKSQAGAAPETRSLPEEHLDISRKSEKERYSRQALKYPSLQWPVAPSDTTPESSP